MYLSTHIIWSRRGRAFQVIKNTGRVPPPPTPAAQQCLSKREKVTGLKRKKLNNKTTFHLQTFLPTTKESSHSLVLILLNEDDSR